MPSMVSGAEAPREKNLNLPYPDITTKETCHDYF